MVFEDNVYAEGSQKKSSFSSCIITVQTTLQIHNFKDINQDAFATAVLATNIWQTLSRCIPLTMYLKKTKVVDKDPVR